MRIGLTLSRHIAARLARTTLVIFAVFIVLVSIVDFTQMARLIGTAGLTAGTALAISFLRGPSLAESVLPFAMLFGAMVTFVQLNRRLELTVARSAGVSAWQMLLPAAAVAFLLGVLAVTVYNPAAATLREMSVPLGGSNVRTNSFGEAGQVWLRQSGDDGTSIIGALRSRDDGTRLSGGVTAFLYNDDGTLRLRVDARSASLEGQEWVLPRAVLTPTGAPMSEVDEFRIHTNLTAAQIYESLLDPATVAFWRLPGLIEIARQTALPATDLRMQLDTLVSLPVLLVAMVFIAAVVSLRFSRTLNLGRLVIAGAVSGFMLYLLLVVSGDLGRSGVVAPGIAAWSPVVLALLVSVSLLLRTEDG
ncbi:MAG: LPS export ABC transporter permease LptG [Bauldia sp.]